MNATILLATTETSSPDGYVIGAIIVLFILGYLFYSLFKPEKF